jgi:hypothetical protein
MTTPVRNESGYFNRNPYNEFVPYGETQPAPRPAPKRDNTQPSIKQVNLLHSLLNERSFDLDAWLTAEGIDSLGELTGGRGGTASKLITALFAATRKDGQDTTKRSFTPEEGFYRKGQDIFRVKISKSGNWYGQMCQLPLPGSGRTRLTWEYVGKRVRLDDAEVLSEAEVGRFLKFRVRCGAELTVKESIERGMGATCAEKVAA